MIVYCLIAGENRELYTIQIKIDSVIILHEVDTTLNFSIINIIMIAIVNSP